MSAYIQDQLDHRQAVLKARSTETLSEAQAALDEARARYNDPTSGSHGYDIARAQDRVEAAKAREPVAPRLMCQELRAEWQATGGV